MSAPLTRGLRRRTGRRTRPLSGHAVRVVVAVTLVYALTLGSFAPADLATGAVLAVALVAALRKRLEPFARPVDPPFALRLVRLPRFCAAVLADVVRGTWDVALRVLGLRPVDRPGVIRIPIGERTERGVAVSALVATLSPGSVLIDIDAERGDMLMHVIDASDPDAIREQYQRFYEHHQRGVFP